MLNLRLGERRSSHTFVLEGFAPDRQYKLHFGDQSAKDVVILGRTLLDEGQPVRLVPPDSSELIEQASR